MHFSHECIIRIENDPRNGPERAADKMGMGSGNLIRWYEYKPLASIKTSMPGIFDDMHCSY